MSLTVGLAALIPNVGGLLVGLAGAATTAMVLRRRYSRDETAMLADREAGGLLVTVRAERDAAVAGERIAAAAERQAYATRAVDMQAIARLEAMNAHQAHDIARLKEEFQAFRRLILRLYPDAEQFMASQVADFEDTRPA